MNLRLCRRHGWHRRSEDNYRTNNCGPIPEALTFERCGKREEKIVKKQCGRLCRLYFCHYMCYIIWKLPVSSSVYSLSL